jgi:enoyl-CoA hydratase/carnithine racemase
VLLTGTGDSFIAALDKSWVGEMTPLKWEEIYRNGKRLLGSLLDVEVPMIAAVNGPALIHSEYLLTCDILLASDNSAFQDLPHLNNNVAPTDGVHVLWPHVLGPGRGRYFLLTQQKLDAAQALALGVCQEVLPRERLMARAREIATKLASQPTATLRYARFGLTQRLKRLVVDDLAVGLAVESLSALHKALDGA